MAQPSLPDMFLPKQQKGHDVTPRKILVTGGAGFIGSHVVKTLLARYPGVAIRVLHLPKENLLNLQGVNVELMAGDITQPADCQRAVDGCDVVFHLAAVYALWLPDMNLMDRVNVEGTRNLLEACLQQQVTRVVYTSSFAVFAGQGLDTACTEQSDFALGFSHYSRTKYESHKLAKSYLTKGLDIVVVCPTCPLGPGDVGPTPTGRVIADAFKLPFMFSVYTDSNYVDVRDCALGHVLALEKGRTGESYILGGENYTHPDLIHRIQRITKIKRPLITIKPDLLKPMAHLATFAAQFTKQAPFTTPVEIEIVKRGLVADATKARRELGLPTRPIEETLRD
ncbi:MAG TPA: NAD-dependent epimerase/dehydratase family protein, partial [Pseudomonadales bacterium]|nr:NAD-dependent epimerase/dehydratase family protein [Pseudomonadales bacterium]